MALLNLQNISLHLGSKAVLDGIDIQIHEGEKISLLGCNGAGKSTVMKLINGDIECDSGKIIREKGLKTSLLPQGVPSDINGTVYHVLAGGIHLQHDDNIHMDGMEEQKARRQIDRIISLLSLDTDLLFENLSAGMKRRVLLGRALVCDPDVLLLDEPTNHLDIDTIRWLEDFLLRYTKTVFFVTHDRSFMKKLANRIIELDRGKLFDWKCDYTTFLQRKEAWLEAEETRNALFDKKLSREEAWIRQGIKARRTRNEGRVRALKKMREERSQRRELAGAVRMEIQKSESSGKIVIDAGNISFGYTEDVIIRDFSTMIERGDRIAIIGPNGCGKSTLIKLLLGELPPLSGFIKTGARIETAYFDQMRDRFDVNRTVRENVTDGNEIIDFNGRSRHVIGYLQDFLFPPAMADVKVEVLSGGEKNRLLLAKLFTRPFNFLVMDEPTNDLDIETIELLEEILMDYKGTLLLVSHDRSFIENVATCVFAFEGDGVVREYAGGYEDWQRKTEEEKKRFVPKEPAAVPAEPRGSKPVKKKLSFRENALLESIPALIEEKENRKKEIISLLSDPALYRDNGAKVAEIREELAAVEHELESLFVRWEELESLKNSLK